jgi:hypothetical protein
VGGTSVVVDSGPGHTAVTPEAPQISDMDDVSELR